MRLVAFPLVTINENCLSTACAGFMLPNSDDPVIWRGPRKNGLIKQFMKDVHWGELDYLVIDTPPGTSDEHISVRLSFLPGFPSANTATGHHAVICAVCPSPKHCAQDGLVLEIGIEWGSVCRHKPLLVICTCTS